MLKSGSDQLTRGLVHMTCRKIQARRAGIEITLQKISRRVAPKKGAVTTDFRHLKSTVIVFASKMQR
jgi:hypothetical protein